MYTAGSTTCVPLHNGICSQVYAAFYPNQPAVVIKAYPKQLLTQRLYTNVKREVHVLKALNGTPAVVNLLHVCSDKDNIFLAFEPCQGGDLFKRLRQQLLNEEMVRAQVVSPLLCVLCAVHAAGFVHRDIKPENIFFDVAGRLVLGDFGLAVDAAREPPTSRLGTSDYMAPEVVWRPRPEHLASHMPPADALKPYTATVDTWAVGVLVYECLLGSAPFPGGINPGCADSMVAQALARLSAAGVSPQCLDFVAAALTVDPLQRPASYQLLQHPWVLRTAARGIGGCDTSRAVQPTGSSGVQLTAEGKPMAPGAAGAAALMAPTYVATHQPAAPAAVRRHVHFDEDIDCSSLASDCDALHRASSMVSAASTLSVISPHNSGILPILGSDSSSSCCTACMEDVQEMSQHKLSTAPMTCGAAVRGGPCDGEEVVLGLPSGQDSPLATCSSGARHMRIYKKVCGWLKKPAGPRQAAASAATSTRAFGSACCTWQTTHE